MKQTFLCILIIGHGDIQTNRSPEYLFKLLFWYMPHVVNWNLCVCIKIVFMIIYSSSVMVMWFPNMAAMYVISTRCFVSSHACFLNVYSRVHHILVSLILTLLNVATFVWFLLQKLLFFQDVNFYYSDNCDFKIQISVGVLTLTSDCQPNEELLLYWEDPHPLDIVYYRLGSWGITSKFYVHTGKALFFIFLN